MDLVDVTHGLTVLQQTRFMRGAHTLLSIILSRTNPAVCMYQYPHFLWHYMIMVRTRVLSNRYDCQNFHIDNSDYD